MTGYYIACSILGLVIAAFIPAMVAACKERRFSRWYIYSVLLFPFALVHSIILKKPKHCIGIYIHDKNDPSRRKKKVYTSVPVEKQRRNITPTYICAVFFSKLIYGAFTGLVFFALFRTFVNDTMLLRITCMNFSLILSVLLSIVEMCGFSRFPLIADEITKRALITAVISVVCSLPLFLLKIFILDKTLPQYSDFFTFACAAASYALFTLILLRRQSVYYSFFSRFFDYCGISMLAYAIWAAMTLILLSLPSMRSLIYAISMPMHILNLKPLADGVYIHNLSYIYSSALAHLLVEIIILFSGLLCRDFKQKEFRARIEYRSAAFRMSRKRILRRHIPKRDSSRLIKPLQSV